MFNETSLASVLRMVFAIVDNFIALMMITKYLEALRSNTIVLEFIKVFLSHYLAYILKKLFFS
jgi:hypothetical protein